jgi:hypothetical protein
MLVLLASFNEFRECRKCNIMAMYRIEARIKKNECVLAMCIAAQRDRVS